MAKAEVEHPTQETRSLFTKDDLLRLHDFKIVRRPRTGSDVWERDGREYLVQDALAIAYREKKVKRL